MIELVDWAEVEENGKWLLLVNAGAGIGWAGSR